jgi:Rad3-related DNA helicase
LDTRKTAYVDVPSTFPLCNRPTFYWPVAKLNARSEEGDYAAIASAIRFISDQPNLADRKGIIHTGSYKLVRRLAPYLRDGPRFLLHEEAGLRETLVKLFVEGEFPYVIVTPSLSTGFNLPYEIGFQVIAKTPFADLGDDLVQARRTSTLPNDPKFGQKSYADDALNQVIQSVGRAVRAPDDMGVSYILDENFWPLYKNGYSAESFKETVRWLA